MSGRLDDVKAAQRNLQLARTELQDAVDRARGAEQTWAQIGASLGMTRQAAFKRFGTPRDPRTGDTMQPALATSTLIERTEEVFSLIDAGDYEALAVLLTKDAAAQLTRDVVLDTWAEVVADTGNLVTCRDAGLELPDGTAITPDEQVLGSLVGHTVIECEAGEWVGRVAYAEGGRIAGLLIVPPDHGPLPF